MKKQFFRVKQLADQTFSRAGKTEALSDDLQDAERRVEFIRSICSNTGKKIALPSITQDSAAREKRLKKNAEYCLGISLLENASSEEDHLLRQVVTDCGKLQVCLANAIVDHEMKIETNVVNPLLAVCENDYPNIMKVKRNLSKLILDMDSARARYLQAKKHGGTAGPGSKEESIREELEEAEAKVEQCRDNLACEMLQLIARESELSMTILEYARLQKNYHTTAVAILDEILPEMEHAIDKSDATPVFGKPLEEHLRVTSRKIAYPIELCVCGLLELGITEEGLFRVAPATSKLRRMKLTIDANCLDFESALQCRDPHVFAGVLKSYLRELPDPILTYKLYEKWIAAAMILATGNQDDGLKAMWNVLHSLPQANYDNLNYILKFLASLASNKHSNKMNPQNIAIVIAPNLIWNQHEDNSNIGQNMTNANLHTVLVDCLVSFTDWFFPGELDFYVTISKDSSNVYNGHNTSVEASQSESNQEMKRTHSNDSLTEPNSPPPGSPKPAVRSRKQKPTAPNPPGMQSRDGANDKGGNRESRDCSKIPLDKQKEKVAKEKTDEKADKKEVKQSKEPVRVDKATSPRQIVKQVESPTANKEISSRIDKTPTPTKEEILKRQDTKTELCDKTKELEKIDSKEKEKEVERKNSDVKMEFSQYEARRGSSGDLSRRTSKSGEDVRKLKVDDGGFCTLRKPPRPMPRTIIGSESEKPAIPERPPQLSRPLSFRMPKVLDSPEDRNVSLERTHMYSVDKQQVAIIQVNTDKVPNERNSGGEVTQAEKPEKPKKPESLVCHPGHHRAASEGSIIDTGVISRPPRPTPPPPPVLTSPTKKNSTDL